MKLDFQKQEGCRRTLSMEFTPEEVEAAFVEALEPFRKMGQVKGFRPGHAPEALIRKTYGKQVMSAVREDLIGRGYRKGLQDYKFRSVADVDIQEKPVQLGQPASFVITMDVEPEVALPNYVGLQVEVPANDPTDQEVSDTLDNYLTRMSSFKDVEEIRSVQQGDMVAVDFTATVDGQPLESLFGEKEKDAKTLATSNDFWVVVDEAYSVIPGYGPQLVGLKVGDKKDISIEFPTPYPVAVLAGKKAVYATTVKKLRGRVKQELTPEFLEQMGVKDEAALRKKIRTVLRREALRNKIRVASEAIPNLLLRDASFDVPESEVSRLTANEVYRQVGEMVKAGMAEEDIRSHVSEITEAAKKNMTRQLQTDYLLDRIALDANITVSEADVDQWLRLRTEQPEKMIQESAQRAKTSVAVVRHSLRNQFLRTRVLQFILSKAQWPDAEAETFAKILQTDAFFLASSSDEDKALCALYPDEAEAMAEAKESK